jgi:hypothetical protein
VKNKKERLVQFGTGAKFKFKTNTMNQEYDRHGWAMDSPELFRDDAEKSCELSDFELDFFLSSW